MTDVRSELTDYGFQFGSAHVDRVMEMNGAVCVRVKTDAGRELTIYASPKGQSLRVFRGGKELK